MQMTHCSIKNYLSMFLMFLSLDVKAQENTENIALRHLDTLVVEIKQALTLNTLAVAERDQIYDIVGSLGLCRPVVQTVLEQSVSHMPLIPENTPNPEHPLTEDQALSRHTPDARHQASSDQHVSSMDEILNKFDHLKQHLVQQVADNKIEATHRESAYTLIGSINLCRPILRGADLLSEKMKAEVSKDQPVLTPVPEHPVSPLNSSIPFSNTSEPIAS